MSFTMFWSLIVCAYYYSLCRQIKDWTLIKKTLQAIFLFVVLLTIAQAFGKDTLLNFGAKSVKIFGIIGNPMIASSFTCVLAPFLLFSPLNWITLSLMAFLSGSSGAVLSVSAGVVVYAWSKVKKLRVWIVIAAILVSVSFAYKTGDISEVAFRAGRLPVYLKTIELAIKRPWGYGIGTFKLLFQVYCGDEIQREQPHGQTWIKTHNDWLQILFETGFPGFILFFGWLVSIIRKVKDPIKLAGLAILATNMMIHFPNRMVQSVFIILMFLAYCSQKEREDNDKEVTYNC